MMDEIENPLPEGASYEPCAYCGARPTWPVVWTYDDGTTYTVYLCSQCDEVETVSIEEDEA
jgi:DNA-directed RNA polymerase subunit RPC12/RpoP